MTTSNQHDAKIRGRIAMFTVVVFLGTPAVAFLAAFLAAFFGLSDVRVIDEWLQRWFVYFGPLTGVVVGYYFASRY